MKLALTSLVVRWSVSLVVVVSLVVILASALDVHCTAIRPSSATVVLACSANRLEARR
jgi:hypothetical protein